MNVGTTEKLTLYCYDESNTLFAPQSTELRIRKGDDASGYDIEATAATATPGIFEAYVTPQPGEEGTWLVEWQFTDLAGHSIVFPTSLYVAKGLTSP